MHSSGLLVAVVVVIALAFDYTNGFHDAATAIATSIATHAMRPRRALALAAVMNLLGAFISTNVATTVGKGIVRLPAQHGPTVVLAALVGAVGWNVITWYFGLPSSSSHALIGGLVGATLIASGPDHVVWTGLGAKVVLPGIISPLLGMLVGFCLMLSVYWLFFRQRPTWVHALFRRLQPFSAAFLAFSHGSNDAQKTMGIISLALLSGGYVDSFYVPTWVIIASATVIALGTFSGGWRIIRTMSQRVVRVEPPNGFATEFTAGLVLLAASIRGYPVSTTHVVNGALMGVGATRRFSAVRWGVAGNIVFAWVLTLPAAGLLGFLAYPVASTVLP
ncbi:MAG: phosphate transporter [Chloroflexi bacterium]|nr:phosphate transporter [Chloroflexota bacterium]